MAEHSGNIFATLAYVVWVPLALWVMRRWPAPRASALLVFGGTLFLPEQVSFDLPGLPEFSKAEITILWVFVGALLFHRRRVTTMGLPRTLVWLIVGILVTRSITNFANGDPLVFGPTILLGHSAYDIVHHFVSAALLILIPFIVGASMFRSSRDLRTLMQVLVTFALVYSALQLVEFIMSPQLHRWVYGFHQHEFAQAMRKGGFRPMVFMSHGLSVALFTTISVFAAAAMHRAGMRRAPVGYRGVMIYLWVILAFSKSVAALLYSLIAVPFILFSSPKNQVRLAAFLGVVFFFYPFARSAGWVPTKEIQEFVTAQLGVERAESVGTRFENEDKLIKRAKERISFGWGTFCRGCIYDKWDGQQESVRDGDWIITLGDWGVAGWLCNYVLMWFPIFFVRRRFKLILRRSDRRLVAALSLIVAFSLIDRLPNGSFNFLGIVCSGALLGCTMGILREMVGLRRAQIQKRMAARDALQQGGAVA